MTFTGGQTPEDQAKNAEAVETVFRSADVVVKETFRCHRCGVTPMATRGVLANWDDADGLTAHITTQRPHITPLALADLLQIPAHQVRVLAPRGHGQRFRTNVSAVGRAMVWQSEYDPVDARQ